MYSDSARTATLRNQAIRRKHAKLQVVWEREQAKIKTFKGVKEDLDQAKQAYSRIEGPYGFTRPDFQLRRSWWRCLS